MVRQNRRRFLAAAGATGLGIGLAGCVNDIREYAGIGGGNGRDGTPTDGTTDDGSTPGEGEPAGEVIEDFADGVDHWYEVDSYGSFEAASDVRNGEGGIRLLADEDEPYVGAARSFADPLDMQGKSVTISLRTTTPQTHRVEVQLVAPDQGNVVRLNRTNSGPTDHWLGLDMGTTHERGDPDPSEVYELRIIGRERSQGQSIDMVVDEVRVHDAPDQGKVVLTWDSCHESHWRAFEIMEEYGFPGVEGAITQAVGGRDRLNVPELREMQNAGWNIVSKPHVGGQTYTEENFSEEEMRREIQDSIDWLEARGFEEGAKHHVAPGNLRDATNLEVLRDLHESAISYGGGNTGLPVSDTHVIGRYSGRNIEDVRKHVGFAEEYNQASIVLWETIGDDPDQVDITEDEFREVLDFVDQADVEVVTIGDLVDSSV